MPCHQHRCCRKTQPDANSLDYVLLAASDADLVARAEANLRSAGVAAAGEALGLRIDCRGQNWQGALDRLAGELPGPARRELRVALIPLAADRVAFERALLLSQPLDAFIESLALPRPIPSARGGHTLSDVFKGQSLE